MRRYLSSLDWPLLFGSLKSCDALLSVVEEVIHTGLDLLISKVRLNARDSPWMTQHLKVLIQKRQQAFHKKGADSVQFKFYRNLVKVVWYPKMDQNVCLSMVKKDQLCGIALKKRN